MRLWVTTWTSRKWLISMSSSFMSLFCPMDHFEVMIGNNNWGWKGGEKNHFQVLIMKHLLHMYVAFFFPTWLYSFTWCFYNSSNYTYLGCIYASWKCTNIHRLFMPNFPMSVHEACAWARWTPQIWMKFYYCVEVWCTLSYYVHTWNWTKMGSRTSWGWRLVLGYAQKHYPIWIGVSS